MSHKTILVQRPTFTRAVRLLVLAGLFLAGFCVGLILLSFTDDLVQYQRHVSKNTSLIIGLLFGIICGVFSFLFGRWIWPARE